MNRAVYTKIFTGSDYLMNGQGKLLGWYLPRRSLIAYALRVTDEPS